MPTFVDEEHALFDEPTGSGWDEYGYDYGMPSHNITIRNCQLSTPCAAFAIGSEMSGGVFDVRVSDSRLWDSTAGVHIKTGPGRGGEIRDVTFEDIQMENCAEGFMMDFGSDKAPPDDPSHHLNLSATPRVHNIAARRINGSGSQTVAKLLGLPQSFIRNVSFEFVHFDGGAYTCANLVGTYHDMVPQPCSDLMPIVESLLPGRRSPFRHLSWNDEHG